MSNEILRILRQRLAIQVEQQRQLGRNAPAYLQLEIDDARQQIALIKVQMRDARQVVRHEAIDFPA